MSHETVRRWRANGWRPLVREQHPLDAARAALDDAIPVLTRDPLTTAESATVVVAQGLMLQPDIAVTRPVEVGNLLSSLAKCAQAVSAGFGQAVTMQAGEAKSVGK